MGAVVFFSHFLEAKMKSSLGIGVSVSMSISVQVTFSRVYIADKSGFPPEFLNHHYDTTDFTIPEWFLWLNFRLDFMSRFI